MNETLILEIIFWSALFMVFYTIWATVSSSTPSSS